MHRPGGRCYVLRATIQLRLFSGLLSSWLIPLLDSGLSQCLSQVQWPIEVRDTSLEVDFELREAHRQPATASKAGSSCSAGLSY
jgi:hypothetical protein